LGPNQFSERAVFEALVNAAAHRDHSIYDSAIRFFLFDDCWERYSPGALPGMITPGTMPFRISTRGELIISLFSETPVAESLDDLERGC